MLLSGFHLIWVKDDRLRHLIERNILQKSIYRAVELCVYLCNMYGLTERNIICHSEGARLGASGHSDVMHWFPKHGENIDSFRAVKSMPKHEFKVGDIVS